MSSDRPDIGILMLGGAKRLTMAGCLAEAFMRLGFEPEFYSYELSAEEPIAEAATVITGLRWGDPGLMDHLRRVCRDNGINIVLPFVDGAIEPAARLAREDDGIYCPCCSPELSAVLFDKVRSAEVFAAAGLEIPATWKPGTPAAFPLIAKPRCGSASKGIRILTDEAALAALDRPADYLVQEYVEGAEEITVDCFVTRSGDVAAVSPRLRLLTLGGEVTRTVTIAEADVTEGAVRAVKALGLRGAVTLQYLRTPSRLLLMEINPRLGGGATASIAAGADIAAMIAEEALGYPVEPRQAEADVLTVRCFRDVTLKRNHNSEQH